MKYKIVYAHIHYQDDKIIDIRWGVENVGFGQLIIDSKTKKIIDDEGMGEEFCQTIIDYVYDN